MDAETAVGKWQPDDWKLAPQSHAKALPTEARQLIDVLMRSDIDVTKQEYDLTDQDAITAQREYKIWGRRAIYLYSAAAIFGAFVLYASSQAPAGSMVGLIGAEVRLPLLLLQGVWLAGAAYYTYLLRENEPFERWTNSRARAELERRRLFEQVLDASSDAKKTENEIDLPALKLEYFRRYHLEAQLNYCMERVAHHEKAARRLVTAGALFAFVATLGVALGGLATDLGRWIAPVALVGVAAPVLVSAAGNLKLLSQDRRNAIRYRRAAEDLRQQQRMLPDARTKVAAGDVDALRRFAKDVSDIVSRENSEWLAATTQADQRPRFSQSGSPPQPAPAPKPAP